MSPIARWTWTANAFLNLLFASEWWGCLIKSLDAQGRGQRKMETVPIFAKPFQRTGYLYKASRLLSPAI